MQRTKHGKNSLPPLKPSNISNSRKTRKKTPPDSAATTLLSPSLLSPSPPTPPSITLSQTPSSPFPYSPFPFQLPSPALPPPSPFPGLQRSESSESEEPSPPSSPALPTERCSETHHSTSSDAQKAVTEFFTEHKKLMNNTCCPVTEWSHDQKNITPEDIIWHAMRKPPVSHGCWHSKGNRTAQILMNNYDTDVSAPPETIEGEDSAVVVFSEAYQNVTIEKKLVAKFFKQYDISRAETLGKFGMFFTFSTWGFLSKEKRKNVRLLSLINHSRNGSKGFFETNYETRTRRVLYDILPTMADRSFDNAASETIALAMLEQAKRETMKETDPVSAKSIRRL